MFIFFCIMLTGRLKMYGMRTFFMNCSHDMMVTKMVGCDTKLGSYEAVEGLVCCGSLVPLEGESRLCLQPPTNQSQEINSEQKQ